MPRARADIGSEVVRNSALPMLWSTAAHALCLSFCCAVACQSRSTPPRSASGKETTQASATTPAVEAPGEPTSPGAVPAGPPPTITLAVVNKASSARHTDFGRSVFDHVTLERFEGGEWRRIFYLAPPCSEPCPADLGAAECRRCFPPMPRPSRIEPKQTISHEWQGEAYTTQTYGEACHCHRHRPVPHGRYRASVCVYPKLLCGGVPCTTGDPKPPSLEGEKICSEREFEHDGQDRIIELVIEK